MIGGYNTYLELQKQSSVKREEVLAWFSDDTVKAVSLFLQHHNDFKENRDMGEFTFED